MIQHFQIYLCPPNRPKGGGQIVFAVDPVGVRVASFPCVIFCTLAQNRRILTKLAQIHCWEEDTSWIYFGDLDLIFKVTTALWNVQNMVSVRYLLKQWMVFDKTCIDTLLGGGEELIRVWWHWLNFQGHTGTLKWSKIGVANIILWTSGRILTKLA